MADAPTSNRPRPAFLFATCQIGAENALKGELARLWPAFHFAYSRPGFLTFKLPAGHTIEPDFDLRSVFARTHGFSLGKATDDSLAERARSVWQLAGDLGAEALHVWQRDTSEAGFRGYEPRITTAAREAEAAILAATSPDAASAPPVSRAEPGQLVLDCIVVDPGAWWVGYHRATEGPSQWPGGLMEISVPHDAISRAYLKMQEALAWSRLPILAGQRFVEIGCAPGGASQALLARGLHVIGVDPAEVDPRLLSHQRFTHVRKRGAEVQRRQLRAVDWLAADMNVAPQYTLDTVEALVTHPEVSVRGLLLTLKLPEWKLAEEIPGYIDRIRNWGFAGVRARQLAHNRQEICVTALRRKAMPSPKPPRVAPRPAY